MNEVNEGGARSGERSAVPVALPDAEPRGTWPEEPGGHTKVLGDHALNVALIDDDEDYRLLLSALLEEQGHQVLAHADAASALEDDRLAQVDVVLTDYQMPGLDGLALCESLQYTHPLLPVVIITAHSSLQSAIHAVRNGAADYVLKPVSGPDIEARLHAAVAAAKRRERRRRQARRVKLVSGETIGGTPYELVRWLGDGGMGSVFEAVHVDIGRRVAVKILHAELCRSTAMIDAFRNEARASVRIGAPNIVEIYDFVELDDERLMLVMEFLEGESLSQLLARGELTPPRILTVARQACRGLAAAHAAGVIHRDVKPDNLLLMMRDGSPDFLKIVDFGISRIGSEEEGAPATSGTPAYMAPELIRNRSVDGRLDQYALGCVLYECFAGRTPFGRKPAEALRGHVLEIPPVPRELARFCRGARERIAALRQVEPVIMRCLAKNPDHRFADMLALDTALAQAQSKLGFEDYWSSRAEFMTRRGVRNETSGVFGRIVRGLSGKRGAE